VTGASNSGTAGVHSSFIIRVSFILTFMRLICLCLMLLLRRRTRVAMVCQLVVLHSLSLSLDLQLLLVSLRYNESWRVIGAIGVGSFLFVSVFFFLFQWPKGFVLVFILFLLGRNHGFWGRCSHYDTVFIGKA